VVHSAFDHCLRCYSVVFFQNIFLETSAVNAYPDRYALFVASICNGFDILVRADSAWVYAYFIGSGFDGAEREPVVEVYVGNERDINVFLDFSDRISRFVVRNGNADYIAADLFEAFYLRNCRFDIGCFSSRHRLDSYLLCSFYTHFPIL
jgi:hypothetical protein